MSYSIWFIRARQEKYHEPYKFSSCLRNELSQSIQKTIPVFVESQGEVFYMEYRKGALIVVILFSFVQEKTVMSFEKVTDKPLYPKLSKSCPKEGSMVIKGDKVRLSDFVRTNGDIYNLCSHKIDLRVVSVFALSTLVIDRDVDVAGSHLKLFLIAPEWVVVGDRRISVDGTIGKYMPRANGGRREKRTGADGKPGDPGGPGGNFFGIGETFVGGHRLVITANGGAGGTGQYGGHGYDAQIARYADGESVRKITCETCYSICKGVDKNVRINLKDNLGMYNNFTCLGLFEKKGRRSCSCTIYGWEGEDGGKGGNGGIGGMGGLPGKVILVALNNDSHVSTYGIPGRRGKNGEGGIGGKSGQNGHNVVYSDSYISPPQTEFEKGQKTFYRLGPNGSVGHNSVGYREQLRVPDALEPTDLQHVLSEHKTWLREVSVIISNNKASVKFYRDLYDNSFLTSLYNVSYLLQEVKDIDEQYLKLKTDADFHAFYDSALGRVYGFAESIVNDTESDQKRRVLFLLYTDIMGRIFNFQHDSDSTVAISMSTFLRSEQKNLKDLKRTISKNNSSSVVLDELNMLNDSRENNITPINRLINESKWYLESTTFSKINQTANSLSKAITWLLVSITKALQNPKTYKFSKWSKQLQDLLLTKSYLTTIELLKDWFSMLSELAEVVSSIVEVEAKVPELLVLEKKNVTKPVFSPDLLHKLNRSIDAFKSKEETRLKELLTKVLNKTRRYPEILTDVTEQILIVQSKLRSSKRLYATNALKSDLLQALKIKVEELSYYVSANKKIKDNSHVTKSRQAHAMLNRVLRLSTLSRGFIDLYNEYSHNEFNIIPIAECVETPSRLLRLTIHYESKIYGMVYPLVQYIEDMVGDTSVSYEHLSKLVFVFVKQELHFSLLKMEQIIRYLPSEFTLSRLLFTAVVGILKDLGGVCTAYVAVFDKLQSYSQLRKLEYLIVNASALVKTGAVFTDVLLSKDFQFLKRHLSSILVLMHYKTAVNTFKNYVFPLAQEYFTSLILPEHFNTYDSFENILSTVLTQIDKMLQKVEDYKILVLTGDGVMSRKDFGSRNANPSEPFFVWGKDQHEDAISKLLSGEKVLLKADITKSKLSESAIKLNSVEFYFKAKNEKIQKSVDDVLQTFMINAKHSGNSQYRFGDEMYLTSSDSLELAYVYERNEHGNPVLIGGGYEYLSNADVMLSPYTTWEIYLNDVGPSLEGKYSFKDLIKFKDDVDFELGGNGYYMKKENIESFDQNVKKYYKPIGKL